MKGAKRIWIIVLICLATGINFAYAALPGSGWFSTIGQNMGTPSFRYVFLATAIITFYYLNKNIGNSISNKWVIAGLSLAAAYAIAAWRLKTDGWEAYMYVILACVTLKARKSTGEHDKVAGIDSGLMYMVAAGILAPFNSLAVGTPIENAFLTHFFIGVGFPVIISPARQMIFGNKNPEGEGLFGMWKKAKEEKKKREKEEKERTELQQKGIEKTTKADEKELKNVETLEKRNEEIARNPTMQQRQQLVHEAEATGPTSANHQLSLIAISSAEDTKRIFEELASIKESISKIKNRPLETPKGRAAAVVNRVRKSIEKGKGQYDQEQWKKLFGENWTDDTKFKEMFIRYCSEEEARKMNLKLKKTKKSVGHLKGVVEPKRFIEDVVVPMIHDYEKSKETNLRTLERIFPAKEQIGKEVIASGKAVEEDVKKFNRLVEDDNRIEQETDKYIFGLKKNIALLANPNIPPASLNQIIQTNELYFKAIKQKLNEKTRNERKLSAMMAEIRKKLKAYFETKDRYDERTENVDIMQALRDGGEEEMVNKEISEWEEQIRKESEKGERISKQTLEEENKPKTNAEAKRKARARFN